MTYFSGTEDEARAVVHEIMGSASRGHLFYVFQWLDGTYGAYARYTNLPVNHNSAHWLAHADFYPGVPTRKWTSVGKAPADVLIPVLAPVMTCEDEFPREAIDAAIEFAGM